jgi:hypothetical protein
MKKSPLPSVLLGILAVSSFCSVFLCWSYVGATREFRRLNSQIVFINTRTQVITSLVNDCLEYSKKNPAINPILEMIGAKPRPGAAPQTGVPK